ncbi:MAG: hypothetical protein ACT4PT_11915, partial [Methanobacteriota archaeon]
MKLPQPWTTVMSRKGVPYAAPYHTSAVDTLLHGLAAASDASTRTGVAPGPGAGPPSVRHPPSAETVNSPTVAALQPQGARFLKRTSGSTYTNSRQVFERICAFASYGFPLGSS